MQKLIPFIALGGVLFYLTMSFTTRMPDIEEEQTDAGTKQSTQPKPHRDSNDVYQLFPSIPEQSYDSIFRQNSAYISNGFDFPVGKPDAANYFKAQKFGQRLHLGEDWNGNGGGNTDLGDPVYTAGNGLVTFASDICCGWGNTVRVIHFTPDHPQYRYVESVYAHMHNINVNVGDLVERGQQVGTIGTAKGRYSAHLHFEMRDFINMSIGPGYSEDQFGYLAPTDFIEANRPR